MTHGRRELTEGILLALPLSAALAFFGAGFGVAATQAGLDPLTAALVSAAIYAGSAQVAAITVVGAGGSALTAIATASLLNLRYVPMGVAAAPALRGGWMTRLAQSFFIVDESWAIASGERGFSLARLAGSTMLLYPTWIGSSFAGAAMSHLLPDPRALGLDAAVPAIFLSLAARQLTSAARRWVAATAALITIAGLPLLPVGIPVLVACVPAVAAGLTRRG